MLQLSEKLREEICSYLNGMPNYIALSVPATNVLKQIVVQLSALKPVEEKKDAP